MYINKFLKNAMPRIFLRDYRAGSRRLQVPIPASYTKRRLSFLKFFLKDVGARSEQKKDFVDGFVAEIKDFREGRGQTHTRKVDTYIISKQNRNYSKYGYRRKAYKKNVTKKNKFALI